MTDWTDINEGHGSDECRRASRAALAAVARALAVGLVLFLLFGSH